MQAAYFFFFQLAECSKNKRNRAFNLKKKHNSGVPTNWWESCKTSQTFMLEYQHGPVQTKCESWKLWLHSSGENDTFFSVNGLDQKQQGSGGYSFILHSFSLNFTSLKFMEWKRKGNEKCSSIALEAAGSLIYLTSGLLRANRNKRAFSWNSSERFYRNIIIELHVCCICSVAIIAFPTLL